MNTKVKLNEEIGVIIEANENENGTYDIKLLAKEGNSNEDVLFATMQVIKLVINNNFSADDRLHVLDLVSKAIASMLGAEIEKGKILHER